jgi:hypothetical protein
MKNVLIAIPALTWQVNLGLATFLCQIVGRSIRDWTFHLVVLPETSPVHFARNTLVGEFLRNADMSHLWFVDHDMIPEESALSLFDIEADIVSGRCLSARSGTDGAELAITAFAERDPVTGAFIHIKSTVSTPTPIIGAGAANLLIRRAVLTDCRMRLTPAYIDLFGKERSLEDEQDAAPAIFRTLHKPNGQILLGEDLDFVYRASALGYVCIYQPSARMGHMKSQDLNSTEKMIRREISRR